MAKWLMMDPKVLIVDEPTRGIDVGSKSEIYGLLSDLAKQGMAIIVVSSGDRGDHGRLRQRGHHL